MSNLGFQWGLSPLQPRRARVCERFFFEADDSGRRGPRTLESETPLAAFPLVAFSISWEMDYVHFLQLLAGEPPPDRRERTEDDPIVLVGGDCARMGRLPRRPSSTRSRWATARSSSRASPTS